jgi:hypothetical protein
MPTMRRPVGIVGLGQLGTTFGQGLLRTGRPVIPVLRSDPLEMLVPHDPEVVLVAVAEQDLDALLSAMPAPLRGRLALVQNELLPPDWQKHGIPDPTIAVVWFEKKRGRAPAVVRTTRIGGPHAELLVRALESLDLPARRIEARDVTFELVRKNVYIVGSNAAGLAIGGGTTGDLCTSYRTLTTDIVREVISIDEARLGMELPRDALVECAFNDFQKDPNHMNTGRAAAKRLARALARADAAKLAVPALRRVGRDSTRP